MGVSPSPHSGHVNLERLIGRNELYLSRIDHGMVAFFTNKDSDDSFKVDFKDKEEKLESVVGMLYRGQEEAYSALEDDEQTFLKVALYDSFEKYRIAPDRKLTGAPFVQHPLRVTRTLIKAGVTDLTTIIAALYHDTAEEFIDHYIRDTVRIYNMAEHEELGGLIERHGFLTRSIKQLEGKRRDGYKAKVAERMEELEGVEEEIIEKKKFIQEKRDEIRKHGFSEKSEVRGKLMTKGERVADIFVDHGIYNCLENYMKDLGGAIDSTMVEMIGGVAVTSYLLTKGTKQNYYDSVNKIFRPSDWDGIICWGGKERAIKEEDIERAIMVKFADCHANTDEIRRREHGSKKRKRLTDDGESIEEITYDEIIAAYSGQDLHGTRDIRTQLKERANALAEKHPIINVRKGTKYYAGFERLYRLYKNVILVNAYRRWKAEEGREIPDVQNFVLVRKTLEETNQIIDHLCSYHTSDSSSLSHYKVYKIHRLYETYKAKGGFGEVTEQSESADEFSFDGILSEVFNPRTMKDRDSIREIYDDKDKMLMAALGIKAQCESYLEDPTYTLKGLRRSGLETSASLDEPTEP